MTTFTEYKYLAKLEVELTKQELRPRFELCSVGTKIVSGTLDQFRKVREFLTMY